MLPVLELNRNRNNSNKARARVRHRLFFAVSLVALYTITSVAGATPAAAQDRDAVRAFDIPAQSLTSAVGAFGRQSGLQVSVSAGVAGTVRTQAVSGSSTPDAALARMLAGSGLQWRRVGDKAVVITSPTASSSAAPAAAGETVLDEISVTASGRTAPADAPYATAAPTSYISAETIDRFRGSNPGDIFRGTPGVVSGDARHGGSAVDVNIRGMQGMGRVAVSVDGAENATAAYQGYQGISNKTYIDPDFIAGADITKGSDAASNGIAGSVAMRTLEASDVIDPGKSYGVIIKGGVGTNSGDARAGDKAGYAITNTPASSGTATPSSTGMDRPALLLPTNGSGSIVAAARQEGIELLVGYALRERGNYYAGTKGRSAEVVHNGPMPYCYSSGTCVPSLAYTDYVTNGGLANIRAGEQVLNTQLRTESLLGKATARFGDGHSLQVGYNGFRSEAGDLLGSAFTSQNAQMAQQAQTTGISLDTGTLRYRWKPSDDGLIDMKADAFVSRLETRSPNTTATWGVTPAQFGLPADYRIGENSVMYGASVENTSRLSTGLGPLALTYGLSLRDEEVEPSAYTTVLSWLQRRDGNRQELAEYAKATWKPLAWLAIDAGLRHQQDWTQDNSVPTSPVPDWVYGSSQHRSAFSPSAGVTIEPLDGVQVRVAYSDAARLPSLIESVSAFGSQYTNLDLKPERSRNWEVGTTLLRDGLFADGDRARLKFGFFDWDVSDYIAREYASIYNDTYGVSVQTMKIYNIDRAHFSGLEMSGRYEWAGFTAELAANYYLDVTFCKTSDTCSNRSLYADYATNQVPPEYTASLTVSQKLFEDRLTIGGRIEHVGKRAIEHGEVTAVGASQFISQIKWDAYTLLDVFAEYKFNDNVSSSIRVENLTDQYYVDPLSLIQTPGPGRTVYASMKVKF